MVPWTHGYIGPNGPPPLATDRPFGGFSAFGVFVRFRRRCTLVGNPCWKPFGGDLAQALHVLLLPRAPHGQLLLLPQQVP